jgi:hypothetical protein
MPLYNKIAEGLNDVDVIIAGGKRSHTTQDYAFC